MSRHDFEDRYGFPVVDCTHEDALVIELPGVGIQNLVQIAGIALRNRAYAQGHDQPPVPIQAAPGLVVLALGALQRDRRRRAAAERRQRRDPWRSVRAGSFT